MTALVAAAPRPAWSHIVRLDDGYVCYVQLDNGTLRAVGCERFAPGQDVEANGRRVEARLTRRECRRRHSDRTPRPHRVLVWRRAEPGVCLPFIRDTGTGAEEPTEVPFLQARARAERVARL